MKKYILEITEEQAHVISGACELLGRLHMGQLHYLADEFLFRTKKIDELNQLRDGLSALEPLATGMHSHAYPGIASHKLPARAQIAFDLQTSHDNKEEEF